MEGLGLSMGGMTPPPQQSLQQPQMPMQQEDPMVAMQQQAEQQRQVGLSNAYESGKAEERSKVGLITNAARDLVAGLGEVSQPSQPPMQQEMQE